MQQLYCPECQRMLNEDNFYTKRNGEKMPKCKKCLTMFVDNWEPHTYLPILKEIDVPYVEEEWNNILAKVVKTINPININGTSVLGKYLSKMKLKQWKNSGFADSEYLAQKRKAEKELSMKQRGMAEEEIKKIMEEDNKPVPPKIGESLSDAEAATTTRFQPIISEEELIGDIELSIEEKRKLAIKWGNTYRLPEYIKMEEMYRNMENAYDIQTPSHKDYLINICKTSLKMSQAIDIGDVETYTKISKVYDMLMKSAKFTAAQNKNDNGEFVDSVGEMALMCERYNGEIERFHVDVPLDIIDKQMKDYMLYVDRLVKNETNLSNLVDSAVESLKRTEAESEDEYGDNLFADVESETELSDEDYEEYYEFLEEEKQEDNNGS